MKNEDKKDEESEDEEEVGAKYQNPVAGMFGHSQIGGNPSRTRSCVEILDSLDPEFDTSLDTAAAEYISPPCCSSLLA